MSDIFTLAWRDLRERKARSFLTLLGVAVGISAIVALMSVGFGLEYAVTAQLSEIADTIIVMPGKFVRGKGYMELGKLTEQDLRDIKRISGVREAAAMISGMKTVEFRGERRIVEVIGIDPRETSAVFGDVVNEEEGRGLRESDHYTCTIGHIIAKDYFEHEINVNDRLKIEDSTFRVVGILEKQGGFRSEVDAQIYIPERDAKQIIGNEISTIFARVIRIEDAENIADEIEERINENHKTENFAQALTMGSFIKQLEELFSIIRAVLLAIASISLIVASTGIMNTMLMSVMERTHEIGVMKAIGARNSDILSLFLFESGIISVLGGISGVMMGVFGANVMSVALKSAFDVEIPPVIRAEVLIGGFSVALLVGVVSGIYPALKAARMSPVEAVRYE